jgi:hypothetical protein
MTIGKKDREENHRAAFDLMIKKLGDSAIDTTLFDPDADPFTGKILRTTWEELLRMKYVGLVGSLYRLTSKGWLLAIDASGISQTKDYRERLGRLLAVLKKYVKGRKDSQVVELHQLARQSGEAEGWIFNVVDRRASSSAGSGRIGATWYGKEKGRLVEIPVDFNLEPIDIASALTVQHLEKIEKLEQRIEEIEADRSQFHCPYCDAEISQIAGEDFPDDHCYVTYEMFACGYATADGFEQSPCPYGANYPKVDEFEFRSSEQGNVWVCHGVAKTARARKVISPMGSGNSKEAAVKAAHEAVLPKKK